MTEQEKQAYEAKKAAEPKPVEAAPVVEEKKVQPITGNTVISPLPGRVIDIKVAVGDKVKVGQEVMVLEAMKMENAIESDYAGTVKQILVAVGDSVQTNGILIEIE